jgi:hypothetical protein
MRGDRLATLGALALAAGGCALAANYDFGKWGEDTRDGGAGGTASSGSLSTGTGAGGSTTSSNGTGASSTSTTTSGGCTNGMLDPTSLQNVETPMPAVGVVSVAVDAANLYWTTGAVAGEVAAVHMAPKATPTLVHSFSDPAATHTMGRGLAIDATNAYWITTETGGNTAWGISKDMISAGYKLAVTTGTYGGVAPVNGNVYYTESNPTVTGLSYVASTGGTSYQLVAFSPGIMGPIVGDATALYLLYTTSGLTTLFQYTFGMGSPLTQVVAGQMNVQALALDAKYVYWSASAGIFRLPRAGGTPEAMGPASLSSCSGLAVDPAYAYCTNVGLGQVLQIPLGTTNVSYSVTPAVTPLRGVAVDCNDVYFAAGTDLQRVARK